MNNTQISSADEKKLSQLIENITFDNINMQDYLYFASDDALNIHVKKIAENIYLNSDDDYIAVQLQFYIKQKILEAIALDIKNADVRPKLMPKNLLLLEIMHVLNDSEDVVVNSDEIYKLDTTDINKKLGLFFFKDKELALRVEYKNFKFLANRNKASAENKLPVLEKKFISKRNKLKRELTSFRNKMKLAKQDFSKDIMDIEGEEKKILERSRLPELSNNISHCKVLKKEIIKKYISLKKDYKTNFKTTTEVLEEALSNISQFETREIQMNSEIKNLHHQRDKFFQLIEKNITQKGSDIPCPFLIDEHLLSSKIALSESLDKDITITGLKKNKRDLIDDCLHFLKAYDLVAHKKYEQGLDLSNEYIFHLDRWINRQEHPIKDANIINTLIPLLIAYLKLQDTNRVDDFLSHIDALIIYSSQIPENFSNSKDIESKIIQALRKKNRINIELVEGRVFTSASEFDLDIEATTDDKIFNWTADTDFQLKVKDIAELFYNNGKNLIHLNTRKQLLKAAIDNKETITIIFKIEGHNEDITYVNSDVKIISDKSAPEDKTPDEIVIGWSESFHTRKLNLIESIQIENTKTSSEETDDTSEFGTAHTSDFAINQEKYNIPDRKFHNIILEADTNLVDFFNTKPLKNQVIYKTKSEKEQFCKDNNIEVPAKSKIYITAKDQTDAVIHVVKRCIPAVKILEPSVIKNKFKDIIKSICDGM